MENTQQQAAMTAEEVISDFRTGIVTPRELKDTLFTVFVNFYASDGNEITDKTEREQISWHMNVLHNMLNKLEKL